MAFLPFDAVCEYINTLILLVDAVVLLRNYFF
jgi:hypothetical protein